MTRESSLRSGQHPALVNWLGYLALTFLLTLPLAVLTVRAGAWQQGLLVYAISCLAAVILLLAALVMLLLPRFADWRRAVAWRALLTLPGALLFLSIIGGGNHPPIHDISTDLDDPLVFTAALERRGASQDELMVICAASHPLAGAKVVGAEDLRAHEFITREPGNAIRDLAESYFDAAGIAIAEVPICAELGSLAAVKHFARCGFGYGIASRAAIIRDVREGALVAIALDPPLATPLEVIFPRDRFRSRLITTFADFATHELQRLSEQRAAVELGHGT